MGAGASSTYDADTLRNVVESGDGTKEDFVQGAMQQASLACCPSPTVRRHRVARCGGGVGGRAAGPRRQRLLHRRVLSSRLGSPTSTFPRTTLAYERG